MGRDTESFHRVGLLVLLAGNRGLQSREMESEFVT